MTGKFSDWAGDNYRLRKEQSIICADCTSPYKTKNPRKSIDGLYRCRRCNNNKRTLTHHDRKRSDWLQNQYGINLDQYNKILEEQNGVCAICKKPERRLRKNGKPYSLAVDHDHVTGKVRGLLCTGCNIALGYFLDNQHSLLNAKVYLTRHSNRPSWDDYFMDIALAASSRSKDPSTKVGAVLVKNRRIISTGYNGLPAPMDDNNQKYWERPHKYIVVIHAEVNALTETTSQVAMGSTIYSTLFPCSDCAKTIIQYGVKEVVYLSDGNPRFKESFDQAKEFFDECKVLYRTIQR